MLLYLQPEWEDKPLTAEVSLLSGEGKGTARLMGQLHIKKAQSPCALSALVRGRTLFTRQKDKTGRQAETQKQNLLTSLFWT